MEPLTPPPWKLDRPLAVIDIESTGPIPRSDRIIDLAVIRIDLDGRRETRTYRVNPGVPIPEETTRIHGITDADVAGSPPFASIAPAVFALLDACDLAGYNSTRFDVPMLVEEFLRAGLTFDVERRRLIDAQRIFHRKEPRDLTAALAFYCGETHTGAHGAEADALATLRVFEGQYQRYPDLPVDMDRLHDFCNPRRPGWVDRAGRLKWAGGEVVLNFGQKKGLSLRTIVRDDPAFIRWMLRSDFPTDTRQIVEDAMRGKWPTPPPPVESE